MDGRRELIVDVPVKYVNTPAGSLALDPNDQVRSVVRRMFDKFDKLGTPLP
jgi:hypothetical protein